MTLAMLYVLATIDGALCGFRAVGGRSPFIRKRTYYMRALLRGIMAAQVASLLSLVALAVAWAMSSHRAELRADLEQAAGRMLWIFIPYAILVLGNLALRLVPSTDIRSATSVMVLGPLTALRPSVMIAGVLYGVWTAQLPATRFLGAIVLALMLVVEVGLNRVAARTQGREMRAIVLE
jgi:hypothetical protein